MVYFPTRKCYHAIKIAILLILVLTLFSLFEKWRGGKRSTVAVTTSLSDPEEEEFERQILEDEARIITGLGEGGVAAHLSGEDKRLGEESEKKLAMNVYLSDHIAYNRTLKDYRNPACARVVYDAELPSVSVILIFHNEPYSVVVRTIWSVMNSARRNQPWLLHANFVERDTGRIMNLGYSGQDPTSPFVYLKEIILVDDNSTLAELKGKLSHYVRTRLPPDLIRILRLPDRQGLIKARLRGARKARGDVLVFLDAHCEVGMDWLRPLLQRIRHKRDAVITPLIDVIDQSTFKLEASDNFQVGGFTFMGHFTWIDVPEREKKRRGSDIAPTWSPTMAGGLFAINRAYYWEIGAYDEQMAGWGGENLEMSFRIWQCGGTLETIPCSRVGHVFRSFHPYGLPAHTDTHGINTARMAEVWMDEYAELFYLHRPDLRNNPKIGDVTHRKVLREKLHCKSFQWYLDNIYQEKFVPVRDVYGYGRFMNPASGFCLDSMQREADLSPLGVYPCHPQLQATQYFSLSLTGELRNEEDCAQVQFNRRQGDIGELSSGRKVLMSSCNKKHRSQKWKYIEKSGQLQQVESGLCLDAGFDTGEDAHVRPCTGGARQRWNIDYAEHNGYNPATTPNDSEYKAREARLQRLRGQRRISRSLLSFEEKSQNSSNAEKEEENVHRRTRKHKRHGNRTSGKHKRKPLSRKNKFIVKLVRTLMNNSEEHLEVDIHCRHRRLYPNNTFVRDLVSILNERNIKVINNGRVFERNKVTDLTAGPDPHSPPLEEVQPPNRVDVQVEAEDYQKLKKSHSKKRKQQKTTSTTSEDLNPVPALNIATSPSEPEPDDKRIIIEDFVEVKPLITTEPTKRPKKKHRRKRTRPTTPAPGEVRAERDRSPLAALADQMAAQLEQYRGSGRLRDSVEETGMLSAEAPGPAARHTSSEGEDWPLGESRFRRNNSQPVLMQPLRRREHRPPGVPPHHVMKDELYETHRERERDHEREHYSHDQGLSENRVVSSAETVPRDGGGEVDEPPPVKLVMRTNLTFNIGDDLFTSRGRSPEASEDFTIPLNTSRVAPPVSLLKSRDSSAEMKGETDDGREQDGGNRVDSEQDESSSSSDDSDTS